MSEYVVPKKGTSSGIGLGLWSALHLSASSGADKSQPES